MKNLLAAFLTTAPLLASGRIVVGPEVLVSRETFVPHAEMVLMANPGDPRHLVGASMARGRREPGLKTFASFDAGATWSETDWPGEVWDPMVDFLPGGVPLAVGIARKPGEDGALLVRRSEDGGRTWGEPAVASRDEGIDRPLLAVDRTEGRFSGRVYLATAFGLEPTRGGVLRSEDGGRTFSAPVEVHVFGSDLPALDGLLVLSDGTVFLGVGNAEMEGGRLKRIRIGSVISADGGVTFSSWRSASLAQEIDPSLPFLESGALRFAADVRGSTYRDRIYAVWTDYRFGAPRVLFTFSADQGATWAEPRPVDPSVPAGARQYQASVAVDERGTVGVSWLDTRHSPDTTRYDQYFTASLDGGASFLPPVRVSSESSHPKGAGNMTPHPVTRWSPEGLVLLLSSVATRWPTGGDYNGFTASAPGRFHLFWADSRTGTSQVYTAVATVLREGEAGPENVRKT